MSIIQNVAPRAWLDRCFIVALSAMIIVSCNRCTTAADAAFVGVLALAVEPDVAKELRLSEADREKLLELIDQREIEAAELVFSSREKPDDEIQALLDAFVAESEKQGMELLTPKQQTRLRQLRIAREGMLTLAELEIREQLKLSDEQSAKVSQLIEERRQAMTRGGEDERRATRAIYERRLANILNDDQRLAWEQLAGVAEASDGQVADAGDKEDPVSEDGDVVDEEDEPSGNDDATGPPADAHAPSRGDDPRPPEPAVVEDRRLDDAPGTAGDDVKLRFNFRYAPWQTVLEWFAEQSNLSLELSTTPPGTFNYTDRRAYTPAEAIDLLNSVLLTKGYTLVRHRRMLMVINLEDGVPPNLIETVSVDELDERGRYELISVLFKLEEISAEDAEREISKLLGPQGSIVVLPKTGGLLVTETGGTLRTIRDLLKVAEKPAEAAEGKLNEIVLEHAIVEEVLGVVRQLMGLPEDRNAAPDGSLRIAVDALGTRLFVTGDPEKTAKVMEIVKLIDVPDALDEANDPKLIETPQLEVYAISSADPESVLKVMQTLLAGEPGVRLDVDPRSGNLVALARPSQHATIKATIDQMQSDARQIEVIQLRVVDPQLAVLSINKLFNVGGENADNRAPTVDADPTSGQLLIRGTQAQITQIRTLLEKMGETGFDEQGQVGVAQRGHVRMLPYTGRSAQSALDQIEMIWPTMRRNRIRVVSPSQAVRSMRAGGRREELRSLPPELFNPDRLRDFLDRLNIRPPTVEGGPPTPGASEGDDRDADEDNHEEEDAAQPESETSIKGRNRSRVTSLRRLLLESEQSDFRPTPGVGRSGLLSGPARGSAQRVGTKSGGLRFVAHQPTVQAESAPSNESHSGEESPEAEAETAGMDNGRTRDKQDNREQDDSDDTQVDEPLPEIIVAPGPHGILIASEDLDALDEFEALLETLSARTVSGRQYTVFYLKYARAEVAQALLTEILGGGTGGDTGGGGNLFGDLASAALGDAGGGLMGTLLGLGGSGGTITTAGAVTIVADQRLNALVVQASPADLDIVEQLLEVIDQEASPEDVQTFAKPRLIPVFYTKAEEIAVVVRQVYATRIAGASSSQRQPSPEEFIRALRGGRGRRSSRDAQTDEQKMSVGVDTRSNSLVVSAPEPLFQEVKLLVQQLDQAGAEETETMRVVTLNNASPELVQRAIVSITGGKVSTNTTSAAINGSDTEDLRRVGSSRDRDRDDDDRGPTPREMQEQIRRRIEFFNALQRGGLGRDQDGRSGDRGGGFRGGESPFRRGGGNFGRGSGERGGDGGRRER